MKTSECQSMTIDNHTNLDDRNLIDYQYQTINWHSLPTIVIDCHRLSISSIGYALCVNNKPLLYHKLFDCWHSVDRYT